MCNLLRKAQREIVFPQTAQNARRSGALMKRNWIIAVAAGLAAAIVIGIAAWQLGWLSSGGKKGAPNGGLFSGLIKTMTPQQMAEAPDFAFRRVEIDTTKAQAEACIVFTRKLDDTGKTHYQDYISIDPETAVAAHVADQRLCLAGLKFNQTYTLTLKTGLPAATGEKLTEAETVPLELRDKPALVRFSGGIILPRDNTEGVPVTTVNIDKLKLKIIRVGDRLLSQIESGTVDQTTLYSYDATQLENSQGSLVWSGTMDVADVKNDSVVTLIPISDILKGKKPGAYVLIAGDAAKKADSSGEGEEGDSDSGSLATQWVIDSDIGLTTFQGANGLTVFARSYASAKPLEGVKLTLVARNNNQLANAITDSDGRADFSAGLFRGKGGDEPVVVMAYGNEQDFSFLDLRRPAFDLTDRGVGGRNTPGPVDAYLYTERGIYRPGETVQSVAMLRDRIGAAISAPLTLVAQRPDGLEVARTTISSGTLSAGSVAWPVSLSKMAPHGRWQISAYIDPKADPVGRVQFDVADFVPQRLKVTLTPEEKILHPGEDMHVKAESRFLYGAPASGLSGEGEARITHDENPFPALTGYSFGRIEDKFEDVLVTLTVPETDSAGVTTASGSVGDLADTTLPLKAVVKVSIHEPGGRTTDKTVELPVRSGDVMLGIRPDFDDGSVAENAKAGFEIIAVDANGKRIARNGLTYSWVRENTTYQWYQDNSEWKYQSVTRDRLVTSGSLSVGAGASAKLSQALPWGTYRLTISDAAAKTSSSYRFYSGWAASAAGDRPDRIPVAAGKPAYRDGETAHVSIKPNADGRALVVVAGDRVFSSKLINTSASGTTVDIPVSADWGPGAYVLVTDYRPLNEATGREPVRSIGVAWLGIDNAPRSLGVTIGGPQKILPRQRIMIPVLIKNLDGGENAWVTLAAVDEGILQLTEFKSPDPAAYYFGKRKLGVGMRDDYGRLIKPEKGAVGSLREGGDEFGGRPLAVVPTRTVALFSGLVKIGADGKVNVPLNIPDFNGELRLMAVAFSDKKLGAASRPLTVRDPVVADIVLPRFLAPGDHASAALNLDNVDGRSGNYTAVIKASGPVGMEGGAKQTVVTRDLAQGKRALIPIGLQGNGTGMATISLVLSGPQLKLNHSWQIEVRAPQLDIARDDVAPLDTQQSYTANASLLNDIMPGSANVALTVSSSHGYNNVPGLLRWLDKYPYGCIEQTTSAAMPLLYFNDMADLAGLPRNQALHDRIQNAVDTVLDMQNYAGNFGMWSAGSDADPWISVFALDFLSQAKSKAYIVPNDALKRGTGWLRQAATSDSNDDATRGYAFYLLARLGQGNLSDLRYFSDTKGPDMSSAIAAALTGAAAAQAGDRSRATVGFGRARDIAMQADPATYSTADYGSLVRDLAGSTALAMEGGAPQLVPALLKRTGDVDLRINDTTTQEKAWMLRAAYELTKQHSPLHILVNGQPAQERGGAVRVSPTLQQLNAGITFLNKGDAQVWRDASVQGTPSTPLPSEASGLTLSKAVWTMSGQPADLSHLKQNDRVIVALSGHMDNNFHRQMGAIDLLPAGLEIEMPLKSQDAKPYQFLGELTDTTMADARDDRFVAAFTIGGRYSGEKVKAPEPQPEFHLAYIARAITTGSYVMPAGVVEDMYAPGVHARTALGNLTIGQ